MIVFPYSPSKGLKQQPYYFRVLTNVIHYTLKCLGGYTIETLKYIYLKRKLRNVAGSRYIVTLLPSFGP